MRRSVVLVLVALLLAPAGSVLASNGGGPDWTPTPVDELPDDRSDWWPDETVLTDARERAFDWLDDLQEADGSFDEDYGVTALVTFAMLNGGRDADHPVVAKALARVLADVQEDGAFSEGTYVHYYTSLAIMALSAGGEEGAEQLVRDGVDMLVREQCDGDEEGFEEWWRGGIGYGGDGRPDMSNTQFALMAMTAAEGAYPSVSVPRSTWERAILFLNRCQNMPSVNDMDWDDNVSAPSYDDGGFIYYPGRSNVDSLGSYGSMTASGLWCLLAAGESLDSGTASAALDWLATHFSATENPVIGDSGYYYYVWAAARALRTAGAPALTAHDGSSLYWARELATGLLSEQEATGFWMNTGSERWWEGNAAVATAFAALAIEAMMPAEDAGLRIRAPEGGTVRVVDHQGRVDGDIPGYSREADGTVVLEDSSLGPFSIEVRGADSVEMGPEVGGTVRVWREVALATGGNRMNVDVAPLMGPASLVVGAFTDLSDAGASAGASMGAVVVMVGAVVVVVAAAAVATMRGQKR